MALRPEIFISAAAPEMNACRKAVRQALVEIGAKPVEQADFAIEYGPLQGILMQLLGKCEAVIHLAGFQFGLEPAERTLHAPRRSFTHYELDVAHKLGLPVYTFIATPQCPLQPYGEEDEDARTRQMEYRVLTARGEAFHDSFTSVEDLGRRVRGLRSRLIVRRSLARLPSRPMGPRFIGRTRLLDDLKTHLEPGSIHLLQPTHGLAPLGGAGTSTLAVELAWRLHDAGELDFVFWLPAGAGADFEAALAALARTDSLSLLADEVVSHRARLEAVFDWLRRPELTGRFVVIVDGVDNETAWWSLKSFLPRFENGSVVLTGSPHAWPGMLIHAVAAFSAEQVREFYTSRLPGGKPVPAAELHAFERLAEALGRVPLTLELAAGHLRETGTSARDLLPRLKVTSASSRVDLAQLFEVIEEAMDEGSSALLRLLVCLAPEPAAIPLALFEGRGDWPLTSVALGVLERRGLILRDESSRTLRVHRGIRQVARDRLLTGHMTEGLGAARAALDAAMQRSAEPVAGTGADLRELLIPHCRAVLGQLNGHPLETQATPLARGLANWLSDCGRRMEAEVFYRRALAMEERRYGPNHPEVAPRLRDLAADLRGLRRLDEAEALYRRALAIAESRHDLGEIVNDLQHLAMCLRAAGRLGEAEALGRRVVELEEKQTREDHPRVALALHRLAGIVEAAHRNAEAGRLYRRALTIDENTFGRTHPRLAIRLYHVGRNLAESRRLEEAEECFRNGLALEEKKLGSEHFELAPVLSELATIVEDLGRPAEAEKLYRRVLRILEHHVGAHHPETALALANLGAFLHESGRAEEALPLYQGAAEALFRERRRYGGDHPHLRSLLANYQAALRATGASEEGIAARLQPFASAAPRRQARMFMGEEWK